ncbi:MAG TPA: CAP domain-containing protein, partial [Streptomyces sp.]|nr:CAP domain-containing protein [Streptomyces sp.]
MGRHRRADPAPAPAPVTPTRRAAGGRHRGRHHRRNTAPVRTGLLGASAAMALGAVAVASGLIPGPNGDYIIGGPADHSGVPADALPAPHTQGTVTPPADRGLGSTASRDDDRAASPSPSPSLRPGKPEATPPGEPAEPTPSRSSAAPAAEADTPPNPAAPRQTPSPEPTAPGGSASDAETAAEDAVLALVNSERVQGGCRPLTADPALAELAG